MKNITIVIFACLLFASVVSGAAVKHTNSVKPVSPPVAKFSNDSVVCTGGGIQFFDSSSNSPTSWLWTFTGGTPTSSTAQNPSVVYSSSGSYQVKLVATNSAGSDSVTKTINVTVNPLPAVTAVAAMPTICSGNSTTLTASGASTYTWSPSAGLSSTTGAVVVANPGFTETYTVTGTIGTCSDSTTVTITVNPTPTLTVTPPYPSICNGGSVTFVVSGAVTYNWIPYTGLSATTGSSVTASPTVTTTYTVTGVNASGCLAKDSATITINNLAVNITSYTNVSCYGNCNGSATAYIIGGTPPYTYLWSNGMTNATNAFLCAGTDSVWVTDASGCQGKTAANIIQPPLLKISGATVVGVSCNGGTNGSISPNVSGGTPPYTYYWAPIGANLPTLTNVTAGTYTLTITDANGCQATAVDSVTQPLELNGNTVGFATSCAGNCNGQASALGMGGTAPYTYLWSNGSTNSSNTGLCAGVDTIYITDANGCKWDTACYITSPAALVITATATGATCFGNNNGSISTSISGGTAPYTYFWKPTGGHSDTVANASAGTYTVTFTDANGCQDSAISTVTQPAPLAIALSANKTAICAGEPDTITSAISGGTPGYTYLWSNGQIYTAIVVSPAYSTTYTLSVTDANACTDTATYAITVSPANSFDLASCLSVCIDTPSFSSASIHACIFNNRCMPVNGTMKLIIDTAIHITATVADTAAIVSGDTLIWKYDSLVVNNIKCVSLTGTVDSLHATDSVFVTEIVTPIAGDSVPSNNTITYWVKPFPYNCVGIPFDPNEKSVYPVGNISNDQKLTYTIQFQNTGTAICKNVVVIDTLSPYVDVTTLKVVSASSFMGTTITGGNIVTFEFDNINLPDTAMSKTSSIGVVQYTIIPLSSDVAGEHIKNNAGIYFDANPVVNTNTTVNTIKTVVASVQNVSQPLNIACFPNPFSSFTTVVFNSNGKHYLEVDDITGRKLESIQCTGKQYELNRNGLATGVYFLRAYDEDQKFIAITKIVIE